MLRCLPADSGHTRLTGIIQWLPGCQALRRGRGTETDPQVPLPCPACPDTHEHILQFQGQESSSQPSHEFAVLIWTLRYLFVWEGGTRSIGAQAVQSLLHRTLSAQPCIPSKQCTCLVDVGAFKGEELCKQWSIGVRGIQGGDKGAPGYWSPPPVVPDACGILRMSNHQGTCERMGMIKGGGA